MEARVRFTGEVYIVAESIEEARRKFNELPLFSAEAIEDYFADITDYELEDSTMAEEYPF